MDVYYLRGTFEDGLVYNLNKLYATEQEAIEAYNVQKKNSSHSLDVVKVTFSIEEFIFFLLQDNVDTNRHVVKSKLGMLND